MKTQKLTILLFISLLYLSCSKENPNQNNESESKPSILNEPEIEAPASLISLGKAKEQMDNYNEAHPAEVGSEYAVRTWISIEELKAYIHYIEKESENKGIEISGVDFIHSQYKQAKPGSANPDNVVYDLTLMLAPTYKNGDSNVAFDPIYSAQGQPKDLKDLFDELESDSISENGPSPTGGSSIANGLSTCPNKCN